MLQSQRSRFPMSDQENSAVWHMRTFATLRLTEEIISPEVRAIVAAALQAEIEAQSARFFCGPPKPPAPRCRCPSGAFWHQPNCPVGNCIT